MWKRLERLKSWDGGIALALLAACVALVTTGCSDDVTQPASAQAETQASLVSEAESEEMMRSRLGGLEDLGIDLTGASGVFMLGWKERFDRESEEAVVKGGAGAVGFAQPFDGVESVETVDMGDVTLSSPSGDIALNERSGGKGTRYSTRGRGEEGTNVEFSGGGDYTFEVSGSDDFAAASIGATAPDALIVIQNLSFGDEFDPNQDLTIEWTGGESGPVALVAAAPGPKPEGKRGRRGGGPGGHGGPKGQHQGRHGGRPHLDEDQIHREVLDSNSGTATISAATIQALLAASESDRLMIHIAQASASSVDRDGETLIAIVRNGDGVGLKAAATE